MHIDSNQSRRAFLRRSAQLGFAGTAAPLLGSLGWIGEAAAAASSTDYKALVCVFLYGGNDHNNTLPPFDAANYNAYRAARPRIAVPHQQLAATVLKPSNSLGGIQYALNPALQPLLPIFNQGKMAVLLNLGNLVEPTTKAQYQNKSVQLPANLFSHNDQQSFTQSFQPEGADAGWGGRMGDMLQSSNGAAALTCISLQGRSLWLSGRNVTPYTANSQKVTELFRGSRTLFGSTIGFGTLYQLITQQQSCWLADEHVNVTKRALQISETIGTALDNAPESQFTAFKSGSNLSAQLRMVARLISVAPSLGIRRQVFFTAIGGWDTHSDLSTTHPGLLSVLGNAMSEFYNSTVQFGVADKVTTFTASDFGRPLAENGDGSDHGWGSTHFVLGGAVKGGRLYGKPPTIGVNTSDDTTGGRLIPTTSIDQFAATLAQWLGVPAGNLPLVLPYLPNYNQSSWNVGFI